MGKARLKLSAAVCAIGLAAAGVGDTARAAEAARSRFISYPNEAECLADRILPAATCKSAFANARGQFDRVATSFPTAAACAKAAGRCTRGPGGFRPQWAGVDIVDTPKERSVTPAGRSRELRYAALPLNGPVAPPRELTVRGKAAVLAPEPAPRPGRSNDRPPVARAPAVARGSTSAAESAAPRPGAGFTLEDGVLTYPAPERFQPRNLPKAH